MFVFQKRYALRKIQLTIRRPSHGKRAAVSSLGHVLAAALLVGGVLSCTVNESLSEHPLETTVVDVGQGTSVIVQRDGLAFVCDMGPARSSESWLMAYAAMGRPMVACLAVSHRDEDHAGGLHTLDSSVVWNEKLVVSPYESVDSICMFLRPLYAPIVSNVAGGDLLSVIPGVTIECLWPPRDTVLSQPVEGLDINRFSLCFQVRYGATSVLITSDIDSVAQKAIAERYGWSLRSDLFVVPHHGSAGAVCALFWGYVRPDMSVISCGVNNVYGHPSVPALDLLFALGSAVKVTAIDGTFGARTNGDYWTWAGEPGFPIAMIGRAGNILSSDQ